MSYAIVTKDVTKAAAFIAQGRAVAVPTGTSYALAVDAMQGHALQRLRNLKKRPQEKTFTVFLADKLWEQFLMLSPEEEHLLAKYQNQALTLLVVPRESLQHLAHDGRVALRVIDHPTMAALAQAAAVPLTATSANVAGEEPCFSVEEIQKKFPGILDASDPPVAPAGPTVYDLSLAAILDGGTLTHHQPTTIAASHHGKITIVRQGELRLN